MTKRHFWRDVLGALSRLFDRRRKKSTKHSRLNRHVSLQAEPLESRELLAVTPIALDTALSQIVIRGGSAADTTVVTAPTTDTIHVRYTSGSQVNEATFQRSAVTSIDYVGSFGNDRFENLTNIPSRAVGGAGDDVLIGGVGVDAFYGDSGNDELWGNGGNDFLFGQEGSDRIYGGDGNDEVSGGTDNDYLYGGWGDDRLTGNEGDDELTGDQGNDLLLGLDGNDFIVGNGGNDNAQGGLGSDRLFGGSGDDNLIGHEGDDRLYGQDGDDVLTGNTGNDLLAGGINDDQLTGNEGNDELYGEEGNDSLTGLSGDDYLSGASGNDALYGGSENDVIYGGDGIDELYGEEGNDFLDGMAGDDVANGGIGNDLIYGGDGNDFLSGEDGSDEVRGGTGHDQLIGGTGSDKLEGEGGNDSAVGGDGDDRMYGGGGNDELNGQAGNDRLYGQFGNDILYGGAGNDLIGGADGDDQLVGHEGNDSMFGEAGVDNLLGSEGDDYLSGGSGNDILSGNSGDDTIIAFEGADQLLGGDGNDALVGGADDDLIEGGSGSDVLIGSDGRDQLAGQWGDDLLIGGITSYDTNSPKLQALAAAWAAAAPYADRIALITDELFSAYLIPAETVLDDAVADMLSGNDGDDWFFQTGLMGVYVPADVLPQDEDTPGNGHHHPGTGPLDHPPELEGFDLVSATDTFSDRVATETVSSSLPHADNSALQREHLSLFETVRYDQVTHWAVKDGNWSDPATWHNGVVPTSGARVLIPLNVEVQVDDVIPARLATIRVDGTLSFAVADNTELKVDTLVVAGSGMFEMGSAAARIGANVTARLLITDDGPINRVADPFGISRGLLSHGRVSIFGAQVTSYVALAGPIYAGTSALALKSVPLGWKVGDTIVIAATTAGTAENETRQITSIAGNIVSLNQTLAYNHIAPRADLEVHVANVTRNAVIESESQVVDRQGHVMFMHNPNVDIAHAGFYHLGRTNKSEVVNDPVVDGDWNLQAGTGTNPRARYAVHFHRTGIVDNGDPATIVGSAVVGAPGWGYVNHSSYVDMVDNVAFNVNGSSFATEVGDEIGSFENNLAIGTTGSGQTVESRKAIQDFGHSGEGFWFQGVGITVTGNISAGNDGSAFLYFARSLTEGGVKKEFLSQNLPNPSIAEGAATIDVGKMPLFEFSNNVGYASVEGLATWYHLELAAPGVSGVLKNSKFWNNTTGVNLGYTQHTVFRNLTVMHAVQAGQPMNGLKGNAVTTDIIFDNLTVSGYRIGLMLPTRGTSVVNGGNYDNATDIYIRTSGGRNALITGFLTTPKIAMIIDTSLTGSSVARYFGDDVVLLSFGPFLSKRLYYPQQAASAVPFPSPIVGLPSAYVGLTNQQLWDQFGVALGNAVAPPGSYTVPQITGLIAP